MSELKPYTSGYMKPPEEHRFKKGKSGNPRGRPPKKSNHLKDTVDAVKKTKVTIKGEDRKITIEEALALKLRELVIKGHPRALAIFDAYAPHATSNIEEPFVLEEHNDMTMILRLRRDFLHEIRRSREEEANEGN